MEHCYPQFPTVSNSRCLGVCLCVPHCAVSEGCVHIAVMSEGALSPKIGACEDITPVTMSARLSKVVHGYHLYNDMQASGVAMHHAVFIHILHSRRPLKSIC